MVLLTVCQATLLCFLLFATAIQARSLTSVPATAVQHSHIKRKADCVTKEAFYNAAVDLATHHTHQWHSRSQGYHILFLSTYLDYMTRMDRYYYDLIEAANRHPATSSVVWGPGFPEWDINATVGVNVHRKYGCNFTFMYFPNGAYNLTVGGRENISPCEAMTVIEEMHDCHNYKCVTLFGTGMASDIVIARYAFVIPELFDKNDPRSPTHNHDSTVKLLAHNPDCADPYKVIPKHYSQKGGNAYLIGHTFRNIYPLRAKVKEGISQHRLQNVQLYKHPGYQLQPLNKSAVPEQYSATGKVSQASLEQYKQYTDMLADAHICVFDSSIVKKTIRKYMEAMLAGCVVVSDLPMDMFGTMHDIIVPIMPQMTVKEIDQVVGDTLQDKSHMQELAGRGILYALQHFTCEAKFERLLDIYETYMEGNYGYYFPYGFRAGCGHTYVGSLNPNWWCNDKRAAHFGSRRRQRRS